MGILKNKSTRTIILFMIVLVLIVIVIANKYYSSVNESVDPRIVKARELYDRYNNYAQVYDHYALFQLLDSIELIYSSTNHYKNS